METAAQVLLIIVSSVLAVFLLLLIIALVFFIKFLRKADDVANSVESAATAFRRTATAMPFVRILINLLTKRRK